VELCNACAFLNEVTDAELHAWGLFARPHGPTVMNLVQSSFAWQTPETNDPGSYTIHVIVVFTGAD
jgi:hypothetical protein